MLYLKRGFMTDKHINNKVKIFISSKCDGENELQYGIMRKALTLLLEETNMCEVFVFEEGTATSFNVVNSYMDPLADADLVIVIVDNNDGITSATMKEINRAKALEKKCIYIFCDQREKNVTELQLQIQSDLSSPRFVVVHEFSDIAKTAYKAVINDVLGLYISYCRGRVNFISKSENEEKIEDNDISVAIAPDSNISKEFFKGYPYAKYVVKKEAGVACRDTQWREDKDFNCACLIGVVIGNPLNALPDFEKIKKDIKQIHTGEIEKIVLMRYEAVREYFNGKIEACVKILNDCIRICDSYKSIPKWLVNDIALDLRNMQFEMDRERGIINFNTIGQKILDQGTEPLYYPLIDRIMADYHEGIVKHQFNNMTQSPYAINIGGIDSTIEKACNTFLVAYCYGSITHMIMLRRRLYEYLTGISLEIREHRIFMFTVKLLLISNDEKVLKRFLAAYGENTNNINDQDVKYLYDGIKKQTITNRNILGRIYLLKHFGYYFSDEQFEKETSILVNQVKEYVEKGKSTTILVKSLFEAMSETAYRFNEHLILEFVYFLFSTGSKRYYDDAFKFLQSFIFKNLNMNEQLKFQNFIIDSIKDENIRTNSSYIFLAAQTLRQMETIDHKKLDEIIKKMNPEFYESIYLLNTNNCDKKESWNYIKRYMRLISSDNATQGENGIYSGSDINAYRTIANIMMEGEIKCNTQQIRQLIKCIQGTLFSKTQTLDAKINAIELLCILQLAHSKSRQINKLVNLMTERWDEVTNAKKLFLERGYSRENLEFNFNILKLILKTEDEWEIIRSFVQIQNSEMASQMTALRMLERLLKYGQLSMWTDSEKNCLFQYVMNSSYNDNYDIRFCAMTVLMRLLNTDYRQLCLERFVEMIDNEPYKNKVGMLYRLKEYDTNDAKVQFIFEKGKSDSHYWVRKVANSTDSE